MTGDRTAAHPVMEHYTKGEVLGKGTFGVVVRATHKLVRLHVTTRAGSRGMPAGCLYMEGLPPQLLNVSIFLRIVQTGQEVAIKKINLGDVREVTDACCIHCAAALTCFVQPLAELRCLNLRTCPALTDQALPCKGR